MKRMKMTFGLSNDFHADENIVRKTTSKACYSSTQSVYLWIRYHMNKGVNAKYAIMSWKIGQNTEQYLESTNTYYPLQFLL